jgi:hypothetical protein
MGKVPTFIGRRISKIPGDLDPVPTNKRIREIIKIRSSNPNNSAIFDSDEMSENVKRRKKVCRKRELDQRAAVLSVSNDNKKLSEG